MTNYGAFIEIEEGIDGLLHVSDISWTKKINHPSEALKKGDKVETIVLSVDQEKKRVALGMKQLTSDPWLDRIPAKYSTGDVVKGRVTKVTNFGVFVELETELEGLLHVSELSDERVEPEQFVKPGQEVEVRVIRVDAKERKIGLSMRGAGSDDSGGTDEGARDQAAGRAAPLGQTILPRAVEGTEAPQAQAERPAAEGPPEAATAP